MPDLSPDPNQLRPRRTHLSNFVFRLPGGTEDNDLWVTRDHSEGGAPIVRSTFVPTDAQRQRIADGENIELVVFGGGQPPVMMMLCDIPLGKPPDERADVA